MDSNSIEFTEQKLQECLTSIYASSRAATEINGFESKLESLKSIRQTLITGENISATNLDQMISEKQVIKGFLEVITHISSTSSKKAIESTTKWTEMLSGFNTTLRTEIQKTFSSTEESIKQLRDTKMDVSEKEELDKQIEAYKELITKSYKANSIALSESTNTAMSYLSRKVETMINENNPNKVAQEVEAIMDEKIKEQLRELKEENQLALDATSEKFDGLSRAVVTSVTSLIHNTISPTNIQSLIASLPEFELLKNGSTNLAQVSDHQAEQSVPSFDAIKESIASLTSELVELKQSNQQTKAVVDTMRSQILPKAANPSEFDHQIAVKRMEEMERNVSVIHNNIKMIETIVKVKASEYDDGQNGSNKRARVDTDGNSVNHDQYMTAIAEVESKHQKLLDFIVQCKDTVLDDEFSSRLEAVVAKIEQVLLNHERFIHFLVDPFAASRNEKVSIATDAVPEGTLSPAMIDAISKLVKKTAEEVSLPLEKKIKLLEEKLQAKSL
ncbi:hypothetical protein HPULCUR_007892 [Helicostylum pulchrum]|uniref:Uncharacterized protein n=1 Tax=Helicostylum pulchrum TaxID=562976 RepID=A0ABP9Y620_9FUNG